ncbi:hypothetical protein QAD02_011414 [Eretmocerus hayati]|uniref:Uncharacterized protein n=1 Tax=Eretmocerus hayati TaxID=131215 RepID=A0ACC2NXP7_9HYME|nr:hypothetical protein QAD02_011414 [Eretmocerus hayati]
MANNDDADDENSVDEIGGNETVDVDVMDFILEQARKIRLESLPLRSKKLYTQRYNKYKKWCVDNKIPTYINEDVMLMYMDYLFTKEKFISSTLWAVYSMIKSCINAYDSVDISNYSAVRRYIKNKHRGHKPKKAKTFSIENVHKFISTAEEPEHLLTKAIFIAGLSGCLRRVEARYLLLENVLKLDNGTFLITIPTEGKNYVERSFTVVGDFADILQKYLDARMGLTCPRLFLTFRNGTFINSPTGIGTVGRVPKVIATFLKLPDIKLYTSHCIRRTAATIFADTGANIEELMRFGVWKSPGCARGYVADSRFTKDKMAHQITDAIVGKTTSRETSIATQQQCTSNPTNFVTAAQMIHEDHNNIDENENVIPPPLIGKQVPAVTTNVTSKCPCPSTGTSIDSAGLSKNTSSAFKVRTPSKPIIKHVTKLPKKKVDNPVPSTSGRVKILLPVKHTLTERNLLKLDAAAVHTYQVQQLKEQTMNQQSNVIEDEIADDSGISFDGQEFDANTSWGYNVFKPTPESVENSSNKNSNDSDSDPEVTDVICSASKFFARLNAKLSQPSNEASCEASQSSMKCEAYTSDKDDHFSDLIDEESSDASDTENVATAQYPLPKKKALCISRSNKKIVPNGYELEQNPSTSIGTTKNRDPIQKAAKISHIKPGKRTSTSTQSSTRAQIHQTEGSNPDCIDEPNAHASYQNKQKEENQEIQIGSATIKLINCSNIHFHFHK